MAPLFDGSPLGGPRAYWMVYIVTGPGGARQERYGGRGAISSAPEEQEGSGEQSEGIAAGSEVDFRDLNAIASAEGERRKFRGTARSLRWF